MIKELTHEDWVKNPTPREMWVWDDYDSCKGKRKVVYINDNINAEYPVIAMTEDEIDVTEFKHCAEIEKPKYRRMTCQELAWWLLDGIKDGKHREYKNESVVSSSIAYLEDEANDPVDEGFLSVKTAVNGESLLWR